jgi:hypothetical protein
MPGIMTGHLSMLKITVVATREMSMLKNPGFIIAFCRYLHTKSSIKGAGFLNTFNSVSSKPNKTKFAKFLAAQKKILARNLALSIWRPKLDF